MNSTILLLAHNIENEKSSVIFADPEITAGYYGRIFRAIIKQITQLNSAHQDLRFAANLVTIGLKLRKLDMVV